jgi:antitoxin (DNA-binding transcriptional repressor) of toxin-antitoxin stability system
MIDNPFVTHKCATMKTASIRELKHDTAAVLEWVGAGESVEVRKHGKLVAVMSPPSPPKNHRSSRPDFAARLKTIYGDKVMRSTAMELLADERGDR